MNVANMPDKIYKEIINKDGQKLVFDFSGLDKLKEIYTELTVNKYNEAKQKYNKRKKIRFWEMAATIISLATGVVFACYDKALSTALFVSIALILICVISDFGY